MKMLGLAIAALGLIAGCSDYPRDSAGTLERVRGGSFTVGWNQASRADPRLQALVQQTAARADSRPLIVDGGTEELLTALERGEIDLVVGVFDKKSPWAKRITFSGPVFAREDGLEGKAAIRNGEHAWAIMVDRAAKAAGR